MILRCVVYSISLDAIVNNNYEYETDNLPIQGLDEDLKVYGEYIQFPEPPFDSRGWKLIVTNTRDDSPHPVYPSLLTFEITYELERLANELLKESVDNSETYANEQLAPSITYGSKRQRQSRILNKKINGINPTQEEKDFLLNMDLVADAMDENKDNADVMYDFIENNPTQVPDFDAGWTTSI